MKKLSINILLILLILTGCFNNKGNSIYLNMFSNPEKVDAQASEDMTNQMLISHIFEGLTTEDKTGKIIPAVAKSWSVNGNVWTFSIDNKAKWHNGKNVKAEDFVIAWERVLNAKNQNKNANMLYSIKGALEYNQGGIIDFKAVGVKALDERTLQVELNAPNLYFDSLVAHPIFYPVNKDFLEDNKDKYGLNKKNILGNGAYEIAKWNDKKIILKKSKNYRDADSIKIKNINVVFNGDTSQLKKMYEENKLDILDLPLKEAMEYKNSKEKKGFGTGEVDYLQFNTRKGILSNKKIRKAIALAINRKAFVDVFKGEIAESFVSGNISGYKNFFRLEYPQNRYEIAYDTRKALKLWEEGLNELGLQKNNIKNITLLVRANGDEVQIGNFLKTEFKKNLDFDINIVSETSQMREQIINSGEYDMTFEMFSSKIADVYNYLKIWNSDSYNNLTGWSNLEYEKLLKSSLLEKDSKKRVDMLYEAEKILMDELPIVPITFSKKNFLVKERLEGVSVSNVSNELNFKYANIKK